MRRFAILLSLLTVQAAAQPVRQPPPVHFGSAADPLESTLDPMRLGTGRIAAFGGPSYIGVTWRGGAGIEAEGAVGPFAVGVEGRLRAGLDGLYEPDVGEVYDLLRLVRYARFNPTARIPVYARLGPLKRVTLGRGELVRDFSTTAAWDERTVGIEAAAVFRHFEVAAFTADVRMDRVIGGRIAVRPLVNIQNGLSPVGLSTVAVGANVVHDLSIGEANRTTAFAADAAFDLLTLGDFRLSPFASFARFVEYGESVTVGSAFGVPALADLIRLHTSLAVSFSTEQFIPGYFNAFYSVANPRAAIVDSDLYFRDRRDLIPASTPLENAPGGASITFELSGAVLGVFELSQFVRRDLRGHTGAFGIRLAVTPNQGRDLRFVFDLQRQGLAGFRDLFSDVADEAVLVFHADYRFSGPMFIFLRSRYGYTRLDDPMDERTAYLVERRFEPMVGIALVR